MIRLNPALGAILLTLALSTATASWSTGGCAMMEACAPRADMVSAPACDNRGMVVMVTLLGQNSYCEQGDCENTGVVLLVGRTRSCHGDAYAVLCLASEDCVVVVPTHAQLVLA